MSLIDVRGLAWSYAPLTDGGSPIVALNGIDLSIDAGSFVGVIGSTGAGKTTLCLALAGIIPELADGEMRGTVTVHGRSTQDTSVADLSEMIGTVQQDPQSQLFCATVEDEIAFPLEQRGMDPALIDRRIDEVLDLVGMAGTRSRVPTSLSGGQMQRVAIAAALAADPSILVLDEPTAALDPQGRSDVFAALARIRRERSVTIVMAEQNTAQLAAMADRIVLLDHGALLRDGGPDLFAREPELLRSLGVALPRPEPTLRCIARDTVHDAASHDDAIRIESLTHRYGAARRIRRSRRGSDAVDQTPPALDDVSVSIPRGAFVGLVGRNGSGKTTLARHLNGLLRPTSGSVIVDGVDTRDASVAALAAHVGYVFQNPDHQIFCSSTRDEIAFGARALGQPPQAVEERVERLLDAFELRDVADASPATLGYGDRRSVALASVLAMRTPILVLDEPTAGLDQRLAARLLAMVDETRRRGATVVMISHDMHAVAEHCTHLLRLEAGRVAAWGELEADEPAAEASDAPASRAPLTTARSAHGR